MIITDYSKIAHNYDKNKDRNDISKDELIGSLYNFDNRDFRVLDLSCGTGNYLKKQINEYPKSVYEIEWIGIDKSNDMLRIAKGKNLDANLLIADVIDIPLKKNSVNYIKNMYAFHHYLEKEKAVKEMYRILKKNGIINLINSNHEYMRYSWVYKYFPSAYDLDNERKPKINEYYEIFEKNGFKIDLKIIVTVQKFMYKDIIEKVINRDISQLNIVTEEEYTKGIKKITVDMSKNESVISDLAIMEMNGYKK